LQTKEAEKRRQNGAKRKNLRKGNAEEKRKKKGITPAIPLLFIMPLQNANLAQRKMVTGRKR